MKKRLIIIIIFVFAFLGVGITYSMYTSSAKIKGDIALASFIVDAERKDHIDIELSNINPGDEVFYNFSISNNSDKKTSDVTIVYNITIKTMHFIPLEISLYDSSDNLVMSCDEAYSRNEKNELECKSEDVLMAYTRNVKDDYYIKILFPEEYNSYEYSSLIDYLNIEINSTQKID